MVKRKNFISTNERSFLITSLDPELSVIDIKWQKLA